MNKDITKISIYLIVGMLVVLGSGILGAYLYKKLFVAKPKETIITSQTIIDKITDRGVLVTKTVYTTESVKINIDQGSDWSNFWWGHEITATGSVKVDVGIDLSKIKNDDIKVNNEKKEIYIKFPEVEINAASLDGEIKVETNSGILKSIFKKDSNEDYNLAISEILAKSKESVKSDSQIMEDSKATAINILNIIMFDTGYKVLEWNE